MSDLIVVKENKLIQKSSFNFIDKELDCLNYALAKIYVDLENIKESDYIVLEINDICKGLEITNKGASYSRIRDAFESISDKRKRISIDDKGTKQYFTFIYDVVSNESKSYIKIRVFETLLKQLRIIKENENKENKNGIGAFTWFYLINSLKLEKKYSKRLYELCKSWQNYYNEDYNQIGVFIQTLTELKDKWCIPENKTYGEIKRDILEKAKKEINEKTDINIDYKEIKNGKKVEKIKFFVKEKEKEKEKTTENNEIIGTYTDRNGDNIKIHNGQQVLNADGTTTELNSDNIATVINPDGTRVKFDIKKECIVKQNGRYKKLPNKIYAISKKGSKTAQKRGRKPNFTERKTNYQEQFGNWSKNGLFGG